MVSDIPDRDGKTANLFYSVMHHWSTSLLRSHISSTQMVAQPACACKFFTMVERSPEECSANGSTVSGLLFQPMAERFLNFPPIVAQFPKTLPAKRWSCLLMTIINIAGRNRGLFDIFDIVSHRLSLGDKSGPVDL